MKGCCKVQVQICKYQVHFRWLGCYFQREGFYHAEELHIFVPPSPYTECLSFRLVCMHTRRLPIYWIITIFLLHHLGNSSGFHVLHQHFPKPSPKEWMRHQLMNPVRTYRRMRLPRSHRSPRRIPISSNWTCSAPLQIDKLPVSISKDPNPAFSLSGLTSHVLYFGWRGVRNLGAIRVSPRTHPVMYTTTEYTKARRTRRTPRSRPSIRRRREAGVSFTYYTKSEVA